MHIYVCMYRLIISSHLILGCYMCFTRIIDLSEFKGKGCSMEEEEVNKGNPPGTFTTHRHISKKEILNTQYSPSRNLKFHE